VIRVQNHGNSQSDINKTHLKAHPSDVTIIHPAHPLRGQTFPSLQRSSAGVLIQLPSGEQRFVALAWTDLVAAPVTLTGTRFLPEQLVALRQRLDALSHKKPSSGTIPPQKDQQLEGGTHGKARSVHAGPIVPGATSPGDRHFSADDPAATEQTGGGETR
jgi:hypothetical protein